MFALSNCVPLSTVEIRKESSPNGQSKERKKRKGEDSKQQKTKNKYKEQCQEALLESPVSPQIQEQEIMGKEPDPEPAEETKAKKNFKRMVLKTIVAEQ